MMFSGNSFEIKRKKIILLKIKLTGNYITYNSSK